MQPGKWCSLINLKIKGCALETEMFSNFTFPRGVCVGDMIKCAGDHNKPCKMQKDLITLWIQVNISLLACNGNIHFFFFKCHFLSGNNFLTTKMCIKNYNFYN